MTMKKQAEYVANWIDTTIHDFLAGIDRAAFKHGLCSDYLSGQHV